MRSTSHPISRSWEHRPRRLAFTLLELALVALIIGTIALIAVPRYTNAVAQNRAASLARRITMDLALAQRQAKFTGMAHKLKFPSASGKYLIPEMEDPDHPGQVYDVHIDEEPYSASLVLADFNCDDEIIYDAFGVPDSGGMIVIDVGAYRKKLTIAAQTGRVTVQDIDPAIHISPPCMQTE